MDAPRLCRSGPAATAGSPASADVSASTASPARAWLSAIAATWLFAASALVGGCAVNPIPVPASSTSKQDIGFGESGVGNDGLSAQAGGDAGATAGDDAGLDWGGDAAAPPAEVTASGCDGSDAAPPGDACSDASDP